MNGSDIRNNDIAEEKVGFLSRFNIVGFAYGVVSNLSFGVGNVIVKLLVNHNPSISEYELIYWKSISMLLFNYLYIRQFGVTVVDVPKKYRNVIVFRAFVGFMGMQGFWGAFQYLPVSIASCLTMTVPIPTAFLVHFFLKE
jgi:drug/metabolite transporter (DMT)-like permease